MIRAAPQSLKYCCLCCECYRWKACNVLSQTTTMPPQWRPSAATQPSTSALTTPTQGKHSSICKSKLMLILGETLWLKYVEGNGGGKQLTQKSSSARRERPGRKQLYTEQHIFHGPVLHIPESTTLLGNSLVRPAGTCSATSSSARCVVVGSEVACFSS